MEYKIDIDSGQDYTKEELSLSYVPDRYVGPFSKSDYGPVLKVSEYDGFKIGQTIKYPSSGPYVIRYFVQATNDIFVVVSGYNEEKIAGHFKLDQVKLNNP